MNANKYRLKPGELRKRCNPSSFKFQSTAELKPLTGIIGQDRAIKAISIALDIDSEGYNIYLAGQTEPGKPLWPKTCCSKRPVRNRYLLTGVMSTILINPICLVPWKCRRGKANNCSWV